MMQKIDRELGIHGPRWRTVHKGYFANPEVAMPLIKTLKNAIALSTPHPAVVVDLGGGTGFVLQELLKHGQYPGVRFINVDISKRQLAMDTDSRILAIRTSVTEVTRDLFETKNRPLLFVMRSVLHYFGYTGLRPFLRHLRAQMEPGEFFVHQTACFEHQIDAQRLNLLYQRMRIDKWYPTAKELKTCLEETGLAVHSIHAVPKLCLTSQDLAERYRLSREEVRGIRAEISQEYGETPAVFVVTPNGFTAYLYYQIFTCVAI